jgi:menaquinone-dependent protoporphyrinogen oxidase
MKPLLILFATRQGQTGRIAEHIETTIRDRGYTARLRNVRDVREPLAWERYAGVVLAASVHMGRHEPEMIGFIKRHRDTLEQLSASFVSVSLAKAGAEDPRRSAEERAKAAADVQAAIDRFLAETAWRPRRVEAVAGALLYSKYNFFTRFIMKRIAKKAAMATDTTRDHEFTDWDALDRFVDELLRDLPGATTHGVPAPA